MASLGSSGGEPEFQVAPMIDVLLTILVFFMMITSAQVLKVDKTIKLPIAADAQKKDNTRNETIVNVRWLATAKKAEFVFDDRVYPKAADLVPLLKAAREGSKLKENKSGLPNCADDRRGVCDHAFFHGHGRCGQGGKGIEYAVARHR